MTIRLKGITWNHTRGYVPVVATAQRFMETHPNVEITWEKRSLQQFADEPIHKLAERYDLLIIDHPWAGFAYSKNILVNLTNYLSESYLADQAIHSVGKSHESYCFNGCQTALAVDAAAPIASYRPDLFEKEGRSLPQTWEDVLTLAKENKVAFAGIPINSLMDFYMLCVTQGEEPCLHDDYVVSEEMGLQVLEQLRELVSYCRKDILDWDPISVYEAMSTQNDIYYCPFAYGYSNYSRAGYANYLIKATDMVSIGSFGKLRSTIGGTGLAISNQCKQLKTAVDYVQYTASPEVQKTLLFESGGQPGHRAAWEDETVNERSLHFFKDTLEALDRSYLRPRYPNYFHFQDHAGDYIRDYNRFGGNPRQVLAKLNQLYRESKQGEC